MVVNVYCKTFHVLTMYSEGSLLVSLIVRSALMETQSADARQSIKVLVNCTNYIQ